MVFEPLKYILCKISRSVQIVRVCRDFGIAVSKCHLPHDGGLVEQIVVLDPSVSEIGSRNSDLLSVKA